MYATFGEHDHLYLSYKARQATFTDQCRPHPQSTCGGTVIYIPVAIDRVHMQGIHMHTHTAYIGPKVLTNFINRQKLVIDASRDLAVSHCVSRLATLLDTLQLAALHSSKSYHVVYHVVEPHPLFLISPLNLGPGHLKFWQISFKQGDQGACGC